MKLRKQLAALAAAGLMCAAGAAQAVIIVNDWKIDLGGLGDLAGTGDNWTGFGVLGDTGVPPGSGGIDQLTFNALFRSTNTAIAVGGTQTNDVVGNVTSALGDAGVIIQTGTGGVGTGHVLNLDFEITFANTSSTTIVALLPGGVVQTSHRGAGFGPDGITQNGILEIWADVVAGAGNTDGGLQANTNPVTGGQGMRDGVLVATFEVIDQFPLATGAFNTASLDGADDALFKLLTNNFNILTDQFGNPLAAGSTLAFNNANTDADDDNNGIRDTDPANFPVGIGGTSCPAAPQNVLDSCGIEDGSFNLAVPEPGTVALLGVMSIGLAVSLRRRRKV
jgi:hypothetical protein